MAIQIGLNFAKILNNWIDEAFLLKAYHRYFPFIHSKGEKTNTRYVHHFQSMLSRAEQIITEYHIDLTAEEKYVLSIGIIIHDMDKIVTITESSYPENIRRLLAAGKAKINNKIYNPAEYWDKEVIQYELQSGLHIDESWVNWSDYLNDIIDIADKHDQNQVRGVTSVFNGPRTLPDTRLKILKLITRICDVLDNSKEPWDNPTKTAINLVNDLVRIINPNTEPIVPFWFIFSQNRSLLSTQMRLLIRKTLSNYNFPKPIAIYGNGELYFVNQSSYSNLIKINISDFKTTITNQLQQTIENTLLSTGKTGEIENLNAVTEKDSQQRFGILPHAYFKPFSQTFRIGIFQHATDRHTKDFNKRAKAIESNKESIPKTTIDKANNKYLTSLIKLLNNDRDFKTNFPSIRAEEIFKPIENTIEVAILGEMLRTLEKEIDMTKFHDIILNLLKELCTVFNIPCPKELPFAVSKIAKNKTNRNDFYQFNNFTVYWFAEYLLKTLPNPNLGKILDILTTFLENNRKILTKNSFGIRVQEVIEFLISDTQWSESNFLTKTSLNLGFKKYLEQRYTNQSDKVCSLCSSTYDVQLAVKDYVRGIKIQQFSNRNLVLGRNGTDEHNIKRPLCSICILLLQLDKVSAFKGGDHIIYMHFKPITNISYSYLSLIDNVFDHVKNDDPLEVSWDSETRKQILDEISLTKTIPKTKILLKLIEESLKVSKASGLIRPRPFQSTNIIHFTGDQSWSFVGQAGKSDLSSFQAIITSILFTLSLPFKVQLTSNPVPHIQYYLTGDQQSKTLLVLENLPDSYFQNAVTEILNLQPGTAPIEDLAAFLSLISMFIFQNGLWDSKRTVQVDFLITYINSGALFAWKDLLKKINTKTKTENRKYQYRYKYKSLANLMLRINDLPSFHDPVLANLISFLNEFIRYYSNTYRPYKASTFEVQKPFKFILESYYLKTAEESLLDICMKSIHFIGQWNSNAKLIKYSLYPDYFLWLKEYLLRLYNYLDVYPAIYLRLIPIFYEALVYYTFVDDEN